MRAPLACGLLVISAAWLWAQAQPPDLILFNGKIVTVDERFSIASAVAITGARITAVGADRDTLALAGPRTRRVDLARRTVIPGLIDNHMHLMRAGTTWMYEVRLDGVASRARALELLTARSRRLPAGEWIYTLGGWAVGQFADNKRPFTRAELDRVTPDHPILLQESYYRTYLNSRASKLLGVDAPTGVVEEPGIRALAARLPVATGRRLEVSTRQMFNDLHRMGLTAVGSAGCEDEVLPLYRGWEERGELPLRVFCITGSMRPRKDNPVLDDVAYGETVYGPLHDPMFLARSSPSAPQLREWRRIATGVAGAGLQLHVHANLTHTIDAFLDQIELIDKERPIGGLRWTLAHVNQLNAAHLARMKTLGVHAAVHPWTIINDGINQTVFGAAAADMPALRTIQDSGIVWGFGSDGSRANQIRPFTTLAWAVTGRVVGGRQQLRQPIRREEALIAHTRRNAFLLFREKDLGSIEAGKFADLVVLDRDYLTVPPEQIAETASLLTMVAGRVVYER
jgi:predicted amidohydrolase YtcJ